MMKKYPYLTSFLLLTISYIFVDALFDRSFWSSIEKISVYSLCEPFFLFIFFFLYEKAYRPTEIILRVPLVTIAVAIVFERVLSTNFIPWGKIYDGIIVTIVQPLAHDGFKLDMGLYLITYLLMVAAIYSSVVVLGIYVVHKTLAAQKKSFK